MHVAAHPPKSQRSLHDPQLPDEKDDGGFSDEFDVGFSQSDTPGNSPERDDHAAVHRLPVEAVAPQPLS